MVYIHFANATKKDNAMLGNIVRFVSTLWLVAVVASFSGAAHAQTGEAHLYTVRDIDVSAEAADATQARMIAMEKGEREGFKRLLPQLLPEAEAVAKAEHMAGDAISRAVRGYEVRNEKITARSYQATLDITFDPQQVSALLSAGKPQPQSGATQSLPTKPAASVPVPSTVLVLPVMYMPEGQPPVLWEENNLWRSTWNAIDRRDATAIRLPIGDRSDQAMLAAAQVKQAPYPAFSVIAERYQAASVLVAEAEMMDKETLNVNLRRLTPDGQDMRQTLTYRASGGALQEQLIRQAAEDIVQRLLTENRGNGQAATQAGKAQRQLTVLVPLQKLEDWVILRKRLRVVPQVERVELSAISDQQADIVLYYKGEEAALASALAGQGIHVIPASGYWVLEL